jgi:hypothetical protein
LAALPGTFDHVPQILWERAIISRIIGERDAESRTHDWALIELMMAADLNTANAATIFRACSDVKTILQNPNNARG